MIRINLLPFRAARKKENVRRQVSIFLLSFFFILLVMFYINLVQGKKIATLTEKVDTTRKELTKYQKINKEIASIKKKLDVLNKKRAVIGKLESNRTEPVALLDAMTGLVIKDRMWFTRFDSKGNTVSIDGMALDNKTVADFMTRLEKSGLFQSVKLMTLQKAKQGTLKSFKLRCTKVPFETILAKAKAKDQ